MTDIDMGGVISSVQAYGDQREAAGYESGFKSRDEEVADLEAEKAALGQRIANLTIEVNNLTASGLAKDEEIKRLMAEIKRLQDLLQGMTMKTQFGFSNPMATSGAKAPVRVYRTFLTPRTDNSGQPSSIAANSGLTKALQWLAKDSDAIMWLSYKQPIGSWWYSLMDDIYEKFDTQRLFLTCWHEPFKEFYQTGKVADWHRQQDAMMDALAEYPRFEPHTIWEEYRKPSNTPDYYPKFLRSEQVSSFDAYNAGIQTPSFYEAPEAVFGEILEWAAEFNGRMPSIAETGSGKTPTDTNGSQRRDWHLAVADYLTGVVEAATVWNSEGCTLDLETFNAWSGQTVLA
jgi:hypothetical protein